MEQHNQLQVYVGHEEGGCVDVATIKLDGYTLVSTAELEALKLRVKEEAYEAYWDASDSNRADRWADNFDESVRAQFETYWAQSHKDKP